jgi:hypothetical protein
MKKYLLIIVLTISLMNFAKAQDATTETTKIKKPKSKQELFIMDIGLDSWMKMPTGINTQWLKSRRFEFYFMKDRAFAHGHLGIAYGIGMSFTNVNSNAADSVGNDGKTYLNASPYIGISPSQNKLSTNYLEIPLELRIRTSPLHNGNRLKLAIGVKVGWDMQDHLKFEYGSFKEKLYNIQNINPFRYAYTARIGYGKFSLMGYYGINTLFKSGGVSNMIPFGLGIAFTPHFGGITE